MRLLMMMMAMMVVAAQELDPVDLEALRDVKSGLKDEPGSTFLSTWDFNLEPCSSFRGLVCSVVGDSKHVTMLNLGDGYAGSPGLTGILHPSIGNLSMLQQLTLVAGSVRGNIPESIGQLTNMEFLGISHNQLNGCIPNTISNLNRLQVVDLTDNLLTCSIPEGINHLRSLVAVQLSYNNLTGAVPAFTNCPLTHLDLSWNLLSAHLPVSLPTSLQFLSLQKNKLKGPITLLASLRSLNNLDMSFNQLSGSIPLEVFNINMLSLQLQRNHLSGSIFSVTSPVKIRMIDLSYNNLSGNISPMFAQYTESLYLNNNHFTGAVPHEFVDGLMSEDEDVLRNLYLQHNFLTGFDIKQHAQLPATTSLCIQYNCLTPPSQSACPLNTGKLSSRPSSQCIST